VNGEKYVFSQEVLEAGAQLFQAFIKIQHIIRNLYNQIIEESASIMVSNITNDLGISLEDFDSTWIKFEQVNMHF
jgi:hypothetical protein